jgi:peptide/nickel transport system permease protein
MSKYIIRRSLGLIPLLLGIIVISFTLMKLAPGGPQTQFNQNPRVSEEQVNEWLARWCLERQTTPLSIVREFGGWFGIYNCQTESFVSESGAPNFLPTFLGGGDNGIIHGDLGLSIVSAQPVVSVIAERIPATLILTSVALVLWVSVAILLGVIAAVKRYSLFDQVVTFLAYIFYSLPTFWLGLMFIFLFAVTLRWLPPQGIVSAREWPPFNTPQYWEAFGMEPLAAILDIATHLIMPVTVLVLVNIAGDSRFVRASMLESLNQDYVRTAKAKGLKRQTVIMKHTFRNAMLPVVTNIALNLPFLFSGAIVTETIFNWKGMGLLFIEGVEARDYFLLMGLILITSTLVIVANLVADVVYAIVDPRIRYD